MSRYKDLASTIYEYGQNSKAIPETTVDGHTFTTVKLEQIIPNPLPFKGPQPEKLTVNTLSGMIEAINGGFQALSPDSTGFVIHIKNHGRVELISKNADEHGSRLVVVESVLPPYTGFKFNTYIDHEEFGIALQQHFVSIGGNDGDFSYVARVSATVTAESVTVSENDGISQRVALRRTVTSGLKDFAELRRLVTLAPYRTFIEVPQPESAFLFRAKDQGDGKIPLLALFDCDGGKWVRMAMDGIKEFLSDKTSIPVIC